MEDVALTENETTKKQFMAKVERETERLHAIEKQLDQLNAHALPAPPRT